MPEMIIPDNLESLLKKFSKISQNFHVEIDSPTSRVGLGEKSQNSSLHGPAKGKRRAVLSGQNFEVSRPA